MIRDYGELLEQFTRECLRYKPKYKITKEEMYEIYNIWAMERNLPRLSKTALGVNLKEHCSFIKPKRGPFRFWEGAEIRFNYSKLPKELLDKFREVLAGAREMTIQKSKDIEEEDSLESHTDLDEPDDEIEGDLNYPFPDKVDFDDEELETW